MTNTQDLFNGAVARKNALKASLVAAIEAAAAELAAQGFHAYRFASSPSGAISRVPDFGRPPSHVVRLAAVVKAADRRVRDLSSRLSHEARVARAGGAL